MISLIFRTSRNWALLLNSCCLFTLLFCASAPSYAQEIIVNDNTSDSAAESKLPNQRNLESSTWGIKTNISSVLLPFKSYVYVCGEWKFKQNWALEAGAGSYFSSAMFARGKGETYRGPIIRVAAKYLDYTRTARSSIWYIGLEGRYQNISNKRKISVLRQGSQYQEILWVNRKVERIGYGLRWGKLRPIGKSERIYLDYSIYLGISHDNVRLNTFDDVEIIDSEDASGIMLSPGIKTRTEFGFSLMVGYWIK